jgi:hypothetical protein
MTWGLTLSDFFAHGLPPAACVPESRTIQSIDFTSGLFELPQHGFFGGESVRLRAASSSSILPTGSSRLVYYTVATPPGPDFFSLVGLTITDNGSGVVAVMENPNPWILAILGAVSSYIVASHKSTLGPWTTPPGWAPRIGGHLAAPDVAARLRVSSPKDDKYFELLRARADLAEAFLAKLDRGEPYSDGVGPVDATPLIAEMGAIAVELESRHLQERGRHEDRA